MGTRCDIKDNNLVTSSLKLVNNPVSEMSSYYSDSHYASQTPTSSTSSAEEYSSYMYPDHGSQYSGPFSYGTYYPYTYQTSAPSYVANFPTMISRDCPCRIVPVQETFLHQILTGKGYKNDRLYVAPRPVIKQEPDYSYHDYGCCYGYQMGYGYPTYH